jgi:hypothetical protein
MGMFRKKPIVIEAHIWNRNGDHPEDGMETFLSGEFKGEKLEGKIVHYYRNPSSPGADKCAYCGRMFHDHGWIDTLEGGYIVCPGDWIIKGIKGEFYPCKSDIFGETYVRVE